MTPEIAAHLAGHDERIKAVETLTERVEGKLDHLLWAIIGGQSALLLCVFGILLKK